MHNLEKETVQMITWKKETTLKTHKDLVELFKNSYISSEKILNIIYFERNLDLHFLL